MGRRPSPTGTPAESSGGWEDVSFDKSDELSVAATNPVRTPTPLQRNRRALARGPAIGRARADFGGRFDPAEWRTAAEQSDHWKRTLACPRREWPCRRAAEKRHERAAPNASCHLIPPAGRGDARPTIAQS